MRFGSSLLLVVLTAGLAAVALNGTTTPVRASDGVMPYGDVDAWFV